MIDLTFLGAAQTVTGSKHLLRTSRAVVLLDCGLVQGRRRESFERNRNLPLDVQTQPQLRTRWFTLDLRVGLQGAELYETALVDARIAPARVVARRWGSDD